MEISIWAWAGFGAFILLMLAIDLGVFHRRCHVVTFREAMTWSGVWIALAMAFNAIIATSLGPEAGMQFLTAYLIEKSLSVDNVFVFATIFSLFAVPAAYQHRVLFWGVFGALVMRAGFIFAGIALLERFHAVIYLFGALLVITAAKMMLAPGREIDPERNFVIRLFRRMMPVTREFHGQHFLVRHDGRLWATPLLVVLLLIEMTDVIFAVDSVPAVLAVSRDPFIVFTSNVFAMLGLRSLYFALAGLMDRFRYLHAGVALILAFVGVKMLLSEMAPVPSGFALGAIATVLTISIAASAIGNRRSAEATEAKPSAEAAMAGSDR